MTGQETARLILRHALDYVLPESAMRRHVHLDERTDTFIVDGRLYPLGEYKKIFVVGGGKAAWSMGHELAKTLGGRITAGVLNVYRDQAREPITEKIELFGADHPVPNEAGAAGARRMADLLQRADQETLVIALISGGGSSMMALPNEGITLEDYRSIIQLMLTVPASIDEMNAVRKRIDPLKGGGMRRCAKDAGAFITLAVSDVPVTKAGLADDPSVIASGPTVGDDSTFETAVRVLKKHGIWGRAPAAVTKHLQGQLDQNARATLPKDSPLLEGGKSRYVMVANNDEAVKAAADKAVGLGYDVRLMDKKIQAEVGEEIDNIWNAVAPSLAPRDRVTFASFSTDGADGNSGLAGAIADNETLRAAARIGLNYEEHKANYDSATFFKRLGLGIETGPTGTNVADIVLALTEGERRRLAFIFGGEATVRMVLPEGRKPGLGGRNTHLVLLAAEKLQSL